MTFSPSSSPAAPSASSTLSPNAAPFTLPARLVCAPRQDGDCSRLIDDNFVLNGGDKKSYTLLPGAHFGMKLCDAVYPGNTHGILQSQQSSSSGVCINDSGYPSSTFSTSGIVSELSVTRAPDLRQQQIPSDAGRGRNGSKRTTVTIRSPPNRTSETNPPNRISETNSFSFGSISKLAIRENDECTNESGKHLASSRNIVSRNPTNDSSTSQGTMAFSVEPPASSLKPLCVPSACATSCVSVNDDVNQDPSECSVDSPCWRGASSSRLTSFDVLQTSAAQPIKQGFMDFDAGQGQRSGTVQECAALSEAQSWVTSKNEQNHFQPRIELNLLQKLEDDINLTKDSCGKELELSNHGAAKCNVEKKKCFNVNDTMKRSCLNTAAPDFIPSSVRMSNAANASCSSTGRNISEILKAIESLSEVLRNDCSDEIEMEEHDYNLLQSVVENLQSYLYKARKGPVRGASDKATLKAHRSENVVLKPVTGNCNGSYNADKGKGIIISTLSDSSHFLDDSAKNSLTGYQNNFLKDLLEEDHSKLLIYKSLWMDAERVNRELKYQLKQTLMEINLESSMAHAGAGPRNLSFQLCDKDTGPSNSYGSTIACPPMMKGGPRNSQGLLHARDYIPSGDKSVLSRLKGHVTALKNIRGGHFQSSSEQTGANRCLQSGLHLQPNRSHTALNPSTSDGVPSLSCITGRDDIFLASCELGSSDWEHVLKDEIA